MHSELFIANHAMFQLSQVVPRQYGAVDLTHPIFSKELPRYQPHTAGRLVSDLVLNFQQVDMTYTYIP